MSEFLLKYGELVDERYRVQELLGEGDFAQVFRVVEDTAKGTNEMAMKVFRPEWGGADRIAEKRDFEAMCGIDLAALRANSFPEVYQVLRDSNGRAWAILMEMLKGASLSKILEGNEPLGVERSLDIAIKVLYALDRMFGVGLRFRDLKPSNIFVCDDETVKLIDFGLAASYKHDPQVFYGEGLGCSWYRAPEVASGDNSDPRSDLFALGLVIHEMLTGKRPWAPGRASIAWPDSLIIDLDLELIVEKLLARNVEDRYQFPGAVGIDLARYMQDYLPRRELWRNDEYYHFLRPFN